RAKAAAVATAAAQEATAVLPKKSKLPLILAGTMVFWLLVGVGIFFYFDGQKDQDQQAKLATAQASFDSAWSALEAKKYADAQRGFERLALEWPDHPKFGRDTRAFGLFARAKLAIEEER